MKQSRQGVGFDIIQNLDSLQTIFEQSYNSIIITTSQLELPGPQIIYANSAFCQNTGYSYEEIIGETPRILQGEKTDRATLDRLKLELKKSATFSGSTINYRKDGSAYWVEWNISPIFDSKGTLTHYLCFQHDITAQKKLEEYKNHLQDLVDKKTKTILDLNEEIEETLKETLFYLGEIAEKRSQETGFHVKRVAKYSELLGELYGLDPEERKLLKLASALHDIGKMAVPDEILHKPSRLSKEEFEVIMKHSVNGYNMLKHSNRDLFQAAATIALTHHEKYNGLGYPYGTKEEEIPIYGRVVAIADVFDALGSDRIYKKAWSDEKIFTLFQEERGKHFDPKLIDLFLKHKDRFLEIREKFS